MEYRQIVERISQQAHSIAAKVNSWDD